MEISPAVHSPSPSKRPAFDIFDKEVDKLASNGILCELASLRQVSLEQNLKITRLQKKVVKLETENQQLENKVKVYSPQTL